MLCTSIALEHSGTQITFLTGLCHIPALLTGRACGPVL